MFSHLSFLIRLDDLLTLILCTCKNLGIAISKLPIIDYVKKIIKLARIMLDSCWKLLDTLSPIVSRAYAILERCHCFKPWPPSDLITECISCVCTAIKHEPFQVITMC